MGAVYAVYCGSCCGPFLAALAMVLGERGVAGGAVTAGLILGLIMGLPFLTLLVGTAAPLQNWMLRHQSSVTRAAGLFLCGTGLIMAATAVTL